MAIALGVVCASVTKMNRFCSSVGRGEESAERGLPELGSVLIARPSGAMNSPKFDKLLRIH